MAQHMPRALPIFSTCEMRECKHSLSCAYSLFLSEVVLEVQISAAQALLDISDGRRENLEPFLTWYRSLPVASTQQLPSVLQHAMNVITGVATAATAAS